MQIVAKTVLWILLAVTAVFGVASSAVAQERRAALIIANTTYAMLPAVQAGEEPAALAEFLRRAGYEVVFIREATRRQMEAAARQYMRTLNENHVALLVFIGHAVEVSGRNYLIPTDARLADEHALEFETLSLEALVGAVSARARQQIVLIDAARRSGLEGRRFVSLDATAPVGSGLAPVEARSGSLVGYSTRPGELLSQPLADSPRFIQALLRNAAVPGLDVRSLLDRVRDEVANTTAGAQTPWRSSGLEAPVSLVAHRAPPQVPVEHRIDVSGTGAAIPLALPAPVALSGGRLDVVFEEAPARGRIVVDGRPVAAGERLPWDSAARAVFEPGGQAPSGEQVVRYRVVDEWGLSGGGNLRFVTAPPPERPVAAISEAMREIGNADRRSSVEISIGVGPRPLGLPAPRVQQAALLGSGFELPRVEIVAVPPVGQLMLGETVLGPSATIPLLGLSDLRFEAPPGSEGANFVVAMRTQTASGPLRIEVAITTTVTECDRLAGDRLDRQGMTSGLLPNEIDGARAVRACRDDIARYGDYSRLHLQLARALLANRDQTAAFTALDRAAELGHGRALYYQGYVIAIGARGPVDRARAAEFYRRSAAAGDVFGMHAFGRALYHGRGIAMDRQRGLAMMTAAAEGGHTFAMNELGAIFQNGIGVPVDVERARRYFEMGVDRDDIYSMNNLGLMYQDAVGVPRDFARARDLYQRASDGGHPAAPNNIGRAFLNGWGVAVDPAAALRFFDESASRGDIAGAFNAGDLRVASTNTRERDRGVSLLAFAASSEASPRTGLAQTAETRLRGLPRGVREAGLRQMIREVDAQFPLPERLDTQGLRRLVQTAAQRRLFEVPATASLDDVLILASRQLWLRSAPRVDLF